MLGTILHEGPAFHYLALLYLGDPTTQLFSMDSTRLRGHGRAEWGLFAVRGALNCWSIVKGKTRKSAQMQGLP